MRLKEFIQPAREGTKVQNNEYGQQIDVKAIREQLNQKIQGFRGLGETLYSEQDYKHLAEQLSELCQLAEQAVLSESDDWFDDITVKRNIKELKTYVKEFSKISRDAQSVKQRMTALYEDVGVILNRYFDVPDEHVSDPNRSAPNRSEFPGQVAEPSNPDLM